MLGPSGPVSDQDCRRIAAEAALDFRTVRSAVNTRKRPRSASTVIAIIAAAEKLRISVSISLEPPKKKKVSK